MKFLAASKLGPKQGMTPEGFLLCEEVPIARTGTMKYRKGEIPVDPAPGENIIIAERTAEELFRPETMASFEGKPVVDEHPDEDVTAENWKKYTIGICTHIRRGTGESKDLLLADLIIFDNTAIDDIRDGKREVSCGYECDYYVFDDRPGFTQQYDIRGNHVALVEIGRCGTRCSIGDHDSLAKKENKKMELTWKELRRRFAAAAKTKDADQLMELAKQMPEEPPPAGTEDELMGGGGGGGDHHTHVHIHQGGGEGISSGGLVPPNEDAAPGEAAAAAAAQPADVPTRLAALEAGMAEIKALLAKMVPEEKAEGGYEDLEVPGEGEGEGEGDEPEPAADAKATKDELKKIEGDLKEEAPEGTKDSELVKVKDSAFLEDSFQEAVALAEILSPGIQIPTFDRAAGKFDSYRSICAFRRKALLAGNQDPDTHEIIEETRGRRTSDEDITRLTCDSIRPLFRSAALAKKRSNNRGGTRTNDQRVVAIGPARNNADVNKRNAEYWSKHS